MCYAVTYRFEAGVDSNQGILTFVNGPDAFGPTLR